MGNSKKSVFKSALDFEARQLSTCLATLAEQKSYLLIVKAALPAEIAVHVQHCVISGQRLLIYAESASWASQIRFFQPAILNKLALAGRKNIIALQIRIGPQSSQPPTTSSPHLPSEENVERLRRQLEGHENDDVLNQALSRLADTLEKRLKVGTPKKRPT